VVTNLLDVNLLIALFWPPHEAHSKVQRWFARNSHHPWATCAITQAGFVRIVSNPSFARNAVSPQDALVVLRAGLEHPSHQFWPDDIDFPCALSYLARPLRGHQQVTDAYLLGLAIQKKGRLVTLDSGILSVAEHDKGVRSHLEVI
jgi:toxin-antitoxin system PIN domain toxin